MPYVDNTSLNLPDLNALPFNRKNSQLRKTTTSNISSTADNHDGTLEFNHLVHDLKSPVNSLKGIVQLANAKLKGKEIQEYLNMIDQCVDKLENKISSTLTMFEKGMLSENAEEINFKVLMGDITASLCHLPGYEKVSFNLQVKTGKPFYASKAVLESVLQNLFENAIKYRCIDRENCAVAVIITDTDEGIQIKFSDNGIGISEDKLPYIFNANFKSDLHKSSNGLGLFIVDKAVEKLKGDIKLFSKEGEGTTFFINLPTQG